MSKTPHDALTAALASRGKPGHRRMDLGTALSAWLAWAGSHACPTNEAAGAYLDGLIAAHGPAGAQSRFAIFQIAAAYTWGAMRRATSLPSFGRVWSRRSRLPGPAHRRSQPISPGFPTHGAQAFRRSSRRRTPGVVDRAQCTGARHGSDP